MFLYTFVKRQDPNVCHIFKKKIVFSNIKQERNQSTAASSPGSWQLGDYTAICADELGCRQPGDLGSFAQPPLGRHPCKFGRIATPHEPRLGRKPPLWLPARFLQVLGTTITCSNINITTSTVNITTSDISSGAWR